MKHDKDVNTTTEFHDAAGEMFRIIERKSGSIRRNTSM